MHMHVYKLAGLYDMSTRVSYLLIRKALWQPYKHFLRKNKCMYVLQVTMYSSIAQCEFHLGNLTLILKRLLVPIDTLFEYSTFLL